MAAATWRGVVKVQRNLSGSHDAPGSVVRINSEDDAILFIGPMDPKLKSWFYAEGHEHKFFAEAELLGTTINFIRKAPWQEW